MIADSLLFFERWNHRWQVLDCSLSNVLHGGTSASRFPLILKTGNRGSEEKCQKIVTQPRLRANPVELVTEEQFRAGAFWHDGGASKQLPRVGTADQSVAG